MQDAAGKAVRPAIHLEFQLRAYPTDLRVRPGGLLAALSASSGCGCCFRSMLGGLAVAGCQMRTELVGEPPRIAWFCAPW